MGKINTMGKINVEWHKANRMPARASLGQRVDWHLAHQKACDCRTELPQSILAELKRRGAVAEMRRSK